MNDPTELLINNDAGVLDADREGSLRDVFEYHVEQALSQEGDGPRSVRIDIGSGFVFLSGFAETADLFRALAETDLLRPVDDDGWGTRAPIRVLMGAETNVATKKFLTGSVTNDFNAYSSETLDLLRRLVADGVIEFRTYLDRPYHAKMYSFYFDSSVPEHVWAGSANFTAGGLSNNIEICVPVGTTGEARELYRKWFDELWGKASSDLDILKVIDEVDSSDHLYYPPKTFFSKLIGILDKQYLLDDESGVSNDILLEFQNLSYYIVMERLQKYGGYLLANSVGLGKSYVACQAMRTYLSQLPGRDCLVVAPSNLLSEDEWKGYLAEFEIEDRVDLLSMGELQKTPYQERESDDFYFDHREYAERYSLVVVDEIHNYRNNSNRRKNLENIIDGNTDADCLFLSATPINLGTEDLFQIIDLLYRGHAVYKFEDQGIRELYDRTRREIKSLDAEYPDKQSLEQVEKIEQELTLKISWRIVREYFEEDLRELGGSNTYSEPEIGEIAFDYTVGQKKNIFDNIVPFLEGLHYEPAKLWDGREYQDEKNLTFWYKWQLYKRLESSLFAFYKSIRNLRNRFYVYATAINQHDLSYEDEELMPGIDSRYEKLVDDERLRTVVKSYNSLDDETATAVLGRLRDDLAEIDAMLDRLKSEVGEMESVPYTHDPKLGELRKILSENDDKNRPTIVFSEWKDTIEYLYRSLETDVERIGYVHGSSPRSKERAVSEFQNGEIDVLLTTDMLAEGVNLPRADSIVNFDLPYNPVLLVQRAGRALRITNPKQIFVYNFRPDESVDMELELYDRLNLRMKTILDVVGLDFVVWMMDEKRVEEIHEEEREEYLEHYDEYRTRVATTNPDELVSDTVPEESKLDRTLRRAINAYGITDDTVDRLSGEIKRPMYTLLEGRPGLFAVARSGDRVRTINEVRDTVTGTRDADRGLTESDRESLDRLMEQARKETLRQRTSKRDLSSDVDTLISDIDECRYRLDSPEMKSSLSSITELLADDIYQPEEVERIRIAVDEIMEVPDIFKSIDDQIEQRDLWGELEQLSQKLPNERSIKLKALIKYCGDER